jgi:hypothetical protein
MARRIAIRERRAIREAWQNHVFTRPSISWGMDAPAAMASRGPWMARRIAIRERRAIREAWQNHVFARPSISWGMDAP